VKQPYIINEVSMQTIYKEPGMYWLV